MEKQVNAQRQMKERDREYRNTLEKMKKKLKKRARLLAADTGSSLRGVGKMRKGAKKYLQKQFDEGFKTPSLTWNTLNCVVNLKIIFRLRYIVEKIL